MVDALPLLQPAECALLLVDQQADLAFEVGSTDCQILLHGGRNISREQALALDRPRARRSRSFRRNHR